MISVLVNIQKAFAAAPSALLGWRGVSMYLHISPQAPSHRYVCASSVRLSAHPPGAVAPSARLAWRGASIHVSMPPRSPSHRRMLQFQIRLLPIYLPSPRRRRTGPSARLRGHLSYVTKCMRGTPLRPPIGPSLEPVGQSRGEASETFEKLLQGFCKASERRLRGF